MGKSSRLPGFYQLPVEARAAQVAAWAELSAEELAALRGEAGLSPALADKLIENVVGVFGLPLGIAANFIVNGREVLVPMAVEEPSIVAGAGFMAKLARAGGGFTCTADDPVMIGQIQLLDLPDLEAAAALITREAEALLAAAGANSSTIIARGGGPRALEVRPLPQTPAGPMLIVHLLFDVRDAQGANLINTACETLAAPLQALTGGRVGLKILSNLADRRLARAECRIPAQALAFEGFAGERVVQGVLEAWAFAAADPYRAATHNKGILNGIDPIAIATGNDWRAIEAGAHAFAARSGRYTSLSTWASDDAGALIGALELPLAVGIVGGSTRVHPAAQAALKLLGCQTAAELAQIMAAVGLAQNLAALRALATEGIQRGHMSLHARQIAVAAGAAPDQVERIAAQLIAEGSITLTRAQELL